MKRRSFFRSLLGTIASIAIAQGIALAAVKVFPREIITSSTLGYEGKTGDEYYSFKEWHDGELVEESYFLNTRQITKGSIPIELAEYFYQ